MATQQSFHHLLELRTSLRHTVQHLYRYLACQRDLCGCEPRTLSVSDRSHNLRLPLDKNCLVPCACDGCQKGLGIESGQTWLILVPHAYAQKATWGLESEAILSSHLMSPHYRTPWTFETNYVPITWHHLLSLSFQRCVGHGVSLERSFAPYHPAAPVPVNCSNDWYMPELYNSRHENQRTISFYSVLAESE